MVLVYIVYRDVKVKGHMCTGTWNTVAPDDLYASDRLQHPLLSDPRCHV